MTMPDLPAQRPTWAEINLDNLTHNFCVTKAALGVGVAIMPAVKADAYGHGAIECARAFETAGAEWFGVALPEEGFRLRNAGITAPILCLGGFWEGQEESIIAHRLTPVVFRLDILDRLNQAARTAGLVVDYHLKVDTGMGRLGVPHADLGGFLDAVARFGSVQMDGIMTHLASADNRDKSQFTRIPTFARKPGKARRSAIWPVARRDRRFNRAFGLAAGDVFANSDHALEDGPGGHSAWLRRNVRDLA